MINEQELERALGLPLEISGFSDGSTKTCYPYKLKNLKKLNVYLSVIDQTSLANTASTKNSFIALTLLLKESFQDEDLKNLLQCIDEEFYKELIKNIKYVSGIDDETDTATKGKTFSNNKRLTWQRSISMIQIYTSNTYEDIMNMTKFQFDNIINEIIRDIGWEYKVSTVTSVKDPNNYIQDGDHPLAQEQLFEKGKRHMTMKDIEGFKKL